MNKGMRCMGKGNEMGRVAWEGRPHCSTTVVRVHGCSGWRGQQWQGAAAEFKLVKLTLKTCSVRDMVHAHTDHEYISPPACSSSMVGPPHMEKIVFEFLI